MAEFTSYEHGTPCWVDVTSTDLDRSIDFYKALFGWAEQDPRPEAGGYTMFSLKGKQVAAGSPPQQEGTPSHWTTYIASDDVDDTAAKIRAAGGTVLMDPFDVFDSGRMTVAEDPTGAIFGVWQAREHHGAQLANEPGTQVWNECQTNDPAAAATFYEAVFGLKATEMPMSEGGVSYRILNVGEKRVAGILQITPEMAGVPPNWSTIFAVADTDQTVAHATELGATVLMPGMDLPDIGRLAVLKDPAGAVFQVLASASQS